jgi:hypothetical protein
MSELPDSDEKGQVLDEATVWLKDLNRCLVNIQESCNLPGTVLAVQIGILLWLSSAIPCIFFACCASLVRRKTIKKLPTGNVKKQTGKKSL